MPTTTQNCLEISGPRAILNKAEIAHLIKESLSREANHPEHSRSGFCRPLNRIGVELRIAFGPFAFRKYSSGSSQRLFFGNPLNLRGRAANSSTGSQPSTAQPSPPTSPAAMHVSTTRSNIPRKTSPSRKRSLRAHENGE